MRQLSSKPAIAWDAFVSEFLLWAVIELIMKPLHLEFPVTLHSVLKNSSEK